MTDDGDKHVEPSGSRARRFAVALPVMFFAIAADQATKWLAMQYLPRGDSWSYLNDIFRLQLTHNYGAFLSLGTSLPESVRHGLMTAGVGLVLLVLLLYIALARELSTYRLVLLSFILAGGLSNLLDRFMYGGYVVDFMNMGLGTLRTGVFNVADMGITFGVILLVLSDLRSGKSKEPKPAA